MTGADRAATITISCNNDKIEIRVTQKGIAENPIELKSPITQNTTLKDLGLPVDYVYKSEGIELLTVENNATLTIEPGVTIQFSNPWDEIRGMIIADGATIKANGTSEKRIQFIGANNEKGSWIGITLKSKTDNQFSYCDFVNAGWDLVNTAGLYLSGDGNGSKSGITHCKFTNGSGYGLYSGSGDCELTAFNNNVFEDFDFPPVYFYVANLKQLEKFDMTSDFTKNKKPYIEVHRPVMDRDVTIHQTTVPYYFNSGYHTDIDHTLTINEGVTICLNEEGGFGCYNDRNGRLMINGTAAKKVTITRLPGTTYHWGEIDAGFLPGSVIKHCIFEYGGLHEMYGVIFVTYETDITLENVEFKNSKHYDAVIQAAHCIYTINHNNIIYSRSSGNVFVSTFNYRPMGCVNEHEIIIDEFPEY
jgi:hypothetical protein